MADLPAHHLETRSLLALSALVEEAWPPKALGFPLRIKQVLLCLFAMLMVTRVWNMHRLLEAELSRLVLEGGDWNADEDTLLPNSFSSLSIYYIPDTALCLWRRTKYRMHVMQPLTECSVFIGKKTLWIFTVAFNNQRREPIRL